MATIKQPEATDYRKTLHTVYVTIIVAIILGWLYSFYTATPDYAGKVEVSQPAKELENKKTEQAQIGTIVVYPDSVKPALNLPPEVVKDKKKRVVAASKVPASDWPHTVTTVVDLADGTFSSYTRTDPKPWLAYSHRGAAGVYYGTKRGEQAIRLQVRQDVLQIKSVHISATASVDNTVSTGSTDVFVGVGAEYRW